MEFDSDEAECVLTAKKKLNYPTLRPNLVFITANLWFLFEIFVQLQNPKLALDSSIDILDLTKIKNISIPKNLF